MPQPDVIIVGASARAAAESALRAGLRPWCVDLFADRDLQAIAPAHTCKRGSYPMGLVVRVTQAKLPATTPVLLTGAMENHRHAVAALEAMHPILGPSLKTMQWLRDVNRRNDFVKEPIEGVRWPAVRMGTNNGDGERDECCETDARSSQLKRWLIKPCNSAGGVAVRQARRSSRLKEGEVYQQYIKGQTLGAVFRSQHNQCSNDGSQTCELLGVTEQITGDKYFGSRGFRYAGSIGPVRLTLQQLQALEQLGQRLVKMASAFADTFEGVFGVDLILDEAGNLWPVEINPRYTASVEVLEKACRFAALNPDSHPMAIDETISRIANQVANQVVGKAYVFAKRKCVVPDLYELFTKDHIADVPAAGSVTGKGHPICTLFAHAAGRDKCLGQLREMATNLYTRLL